MQVDCKLEYKQILHPQNDGSNFDRQIPLVKGLVRTSRALSAANYAMPSSEQGTPLPNDAYLYPLALHAARETQIDLPRVLGSCNFRTCGLL